MWPNTRITKMLKIKYPIIQAPMAGGITSPELVAAVSNAGGLGSLGAGYMRAEEIRLAILRIRALTKKPFAVNLFVPTKSRATQKQMDNMVKILKTTCKSVCSDIHPVTSPYCPTFDSQMTVLIEEKIPVFSFTFGVPEIKWLKKLRHNKTKIIGTATSVAEAEMLEIFGIDCMVAQGFEAGDHRGTFIGECDDSLIGNFALIPQIVDNVKMPVIASGGIMDARGIVAAMMLGAEAVQMGTAFISCSESGAHPDYKKMLLKSKEDNTVLTRSFSGKLARGIKNKFIQSMVPYQDCIMDYPIQHVLTQQIRKEAYKKGQVDYMSLWAGQAAYLSSGVSANELIQSLDGDVKNIFHKGKALLMCQKNNIRTKS